MHSISLDAHDAVLSKKNPPIACPACLFCWFWLCFFWCCLLLFVSTDWISSLLLRWEIRTSLNYGDHSPEFGLIELTSFITRRTTHKTYTQPLNRTRTPRAHTNNRAMTVFVRANIRTFLRAFCWCFGTLKFHRKGRTQQKTTSYPQLLITTH